MFANIRGRLSLKDAVRWHDVRRDHLRKHTCPDSLAHFCERLDTFEQKDLERRSAYRSMLNGESRV